MSLNGISTLPNKIDRKNAKIALAEAKRQAIGTIGYRDLNHYAGYASPVLGRPWSAFAPVPSGLPIIDEDNTLGDIEFVTEDGTLFETE